MTIWNVHKACITTAAAVISGMSGAALAADLQAQPQSDAHDTSGFVDFLNGDVPPGPLATLGKKLRDKGINLDLKAVNIFVSNPSMGLKTGQYENVFVLDMGVDLDLEKLMELEGSTVHFHYFYVPGTYNSGTFGDYGGDSLIGNAGPFIPEEWHLTQLAWEQKLFDGKVDTSFGIDQAGNYFAKPLCNQGFLCQSGSLQTGVGINPPPYANWSARAAYHFTPEWTAQAGFWRSNAAFPFTNGWEGWKGTVTLPNGVELEEPNSNLYLANLVYETTPKTDLYPRYYEAMFYHNDAEQTDLFTGKKHDGTNGIYLGGQQTVWRKSTDPASTSLALYASLYSSFDQQNSYGLQNEVDAGVTLNGPFASRPFDSYSLKFVWNRVTPDAQSYLQASNTGVYTNGRDEISVGVDANFVIAGNLIFQPWVNYVWNPNTLQNPTASGTPKNGVAVGFNVIALVGKAMGL
ncbi:MAG TPA: porin [Rhizobium sp.]|nr:porin [Rhizobium sp.]